MKIEAQTMTLDGAVGRTLFDLDDDGEVLASETRWTHAPTSDTAAITLILRSEEGAVEAATLTNAIVIDMERNMGIKDFVKRSIEAESIRLAIIDLAHLMNGRIDPDDWSDRYGEIAQTQGGSAMGSKTGSLRIDGAEVDAEEAAQLGQGLIMKFMVFSREDDGDVIDFFGPFESAEEAEDFAGEFFDGEADSWSAAEMLSPVGWRAADRDDVLFPMVLSFLGDIDLTDDQISKLARLSQTDSDGLNDIVERAAMAHRRNWRAILGRSSKEKSQD